MIQIRHGVFETNSSSTHSICIPKKTKRIVNEVYFGIGEYGWGYDSVDPASYLYTAILYIDCYNEHDYEMSERLKKLADILNTHDIAYKFEKPKYSRYPWEDEDEEGHLDACYVDHGYELSGFIDNLLGDEDMLLRYLSAGEVYTGNDNNDPDYSGCYIADPTMYEWGRDENGDWWEKESPNPYHDEEKYDYFFKGN